MAYATMQQNYVPQVPTKSQRTKPNLRIAVNSFAAWTPSAGAGSINLSHADAYAEGMGTTSAMLTTDAAGGAAPYISSGLLADALDLTAGNIVLALKFGNLDNFATNILTIYAGSDGTSGTFTNYFQWNYYNTATVNSRYLLSGEWVLIQLDPTQATQSGTPAIGGITQIRIKATGSGSAVGTVQVGLVAVCKTEKHSSAPKGIISLTFDDGRNGQYHYAFKRAMKGFGIRGTLYLVDGYLGSDDANYLTQAQVQEMVDFGFDASMHAFTGATHAARYPGLTDAQAAEDIAAMQNFHRMRGWDYEHMAWPGGEWTKGLRDIARNLGVRSLRNTTQSTPSALEVVPPCDPLRLMGASSSGSLTSLALRKSFVDKVVASRTWGIIAEHQLGTDATSASTLNVYDFIEFLCYALEAGIVFRTMSEMVPK